MYISLSFPLPHSLPPFCLYSRQDIRSMLILRPDAGRQLDTDDGACHAWWARMGCELITRHVSPCERLILYPWRLGTHLQSDEILHADSKQTGQFPATVFQALERQEHSAAWLCYVCIQCYGHLSWRLFMKTSLRAQNCSTTAFV